MPREINVKADGYPKKVLKLIPSEIIAAYITIVGLIPEGNPAWLWGITVFLIILVTPYLRNIQGVTNPMHYGISSVSFLVWVFAMGGPFSTLE